MCSARLSRGRRPVEAVADGLAGRGGDRGAACEAGEGGFVADPAGVRPGQQDLRGRERTDAGLVEQLRRELARERLDLPCELALLLVSCRDAPGDGRAARATSRAARGPGGVQDGRREPAERAPVSERSSARSGSGADTSNPRNWQSPARRRSPLLREQRSAPAALLVRRLRAATRAAPVRARCERPGSRRARRSCRPTAAPVAASRPRAPAHHGRPGSEPDRRRTSRCPRPRTHAGRERADRRGASATRNPRRWRRSLASNTTTPLRTSTIASACVSRCGSTPTT